MSWCDKIPIDPNGRTRILVLTTDEVNKVDEQLKKLKKNFIYCVKNLSEVHFSQENSKRKINRWKLHCDSDSSSHECQCAETEGVTCVKAKQKFLDELKVEGREPTVIVLKFLHEARFKTKDRLEIDGQGGSQNTVMYVLFWKEKLIAKKLPVQATTDLLICEYQYPENEFNLEQCLLFSLGPVTEYTSFN